MTPRIPFARTAAVVLIGGGFSLGVFAAVPAHADDTGTRTVAWTVTTGDFGNRFGTPQTLYTGSLECGTGLLQVDVYDVSTPEKAATVDALVASGHLDSSAQDSSVYLSNTDVELQPCQSTPLSTGTPTPSVTPTPTGTATATSPASTPPTPTATSTSTSVPTNSTSTGSGTGNGTGRTQARVATGQTASELAFTGANTGVELALAGVLLLAGSVAAFWPRKKKGTANAHS